MKTRPASLIVQLALDRLTELVAVRRSEIAAAGRASDGMTDDWLLDVERGVWVLPDAPPTPPAPPAPPKEIPDAQL